MSSTPPEPKSDVPPAEERHPEPTPAAPGVLADDATPDPACGDDPYNDPYTGYEPL
ncbi:hypothetical protein [Streptomyces sp. NBC_00989]|uniref:hypothetical protein n=1 Tax=Streptomyces sp. NBC_00989 TaxID=2903705 RepID=UPI00386CEE28|nr:hypothetical protein OG714_01635 [Streptomyces sp. NBC_00989]